MKASDSIQGGPPRGRKTRFACNRGVSLRCRRLRFLTEIDESVLPLEHLQTDGRKSVEWPCGKPTSLALLRTFARSRDHILLGISERGNVQRLRQLSIAATRTKPLSLADSSVLLVSRQHWLNITTAGARGVQAKTDCGAIIERGNKV